MTVLLLVEEKQGQIVEPLGPCPWLTQPSASWEGIFIDRAFSLSLDSPLT